MILKIWDELVVFVENVGKDPTKINYLYNVSLIIRKLDNKIINRQNAYYKKIKNKIIKLIHKNKIMKKVSR